MVGILHAGLAPVIEVAGVHPNLVLVATVLATATLGFGPGIVWAFVAGLTANLLVTDPLGSLPLSMLGVAVIVAAGGRVLGRLVWLYPLLAALVGSVFADIVTLGVFRLVGDPFNSAFPAALILPAAFLNVAIVGLFLYPVRALAARLAPEENPAW